MKAPLREATAAGTRGHVTWQARPWVQTAGSQTQVCKQKLAHMFTARYSERWKQPRHPPTDGHKQHVGRPHNGTSRGPRPVTRHSCRSTDGAQPQDHALHRSTPTRCPEQAEHSDRPCI